MNPAVTPQLLSSSMRTTLLDTVTNVEADVPAQAVIRNREAIGAAVRAAVLADFTDKIDAAAYPIPLVWARGDMLVSQVRGNKTLLVFSRMRAGKPCPVSGIHHSPGPYYKTWRQQHLLYDRVLVFGWDYTFAAAGGMVTQLTLNHVVLAQIRDVDIRGRVVEWEPGSGYLKAPTLASARPSLLRLFG